MRQARIEIETVARVQHDLLAVQPDQQAALQHVVHLLPGVAVQVHRGVVRSRLDRHDEGVDLPVAESRRQRLVLVGLLPFDRHALSGAGDEIGVHLRLLAEHQHIEADPVMAGYGLQHVHRKIGRAALHLPVLSDRKVAARSHLLLGQFKRFAQPAQTGRNRLNRVTHCLFVLNERSALRVPDEQITIRKAARTAPAHRTGRFHWMQAVNILKTLKNRNFALRFPSARLRRL